MPNSKELLALCDEVLEDGELSYSEIRDLAKWFNAYPDTRHEWPGKLLFNTLKAAWADQKITINEAREIGLILLQIRNEARELELVEAAINSSRKFDPETALLPPIPTRYEVPSQSESGLSYIVDLEEPSCTCPDFKANRKRLPEGHPTRCCKHIIEVLGKVKANDEWPDWLVSFAGRAWRSHPDTNWDVIELGGDYLLISSAPVEWANVYARDGKYGYSVIEDRWSYGNEPENSSTISQKIKLLNMI